MSDNNFHDAIGEIEAHIEALTESIERCRKIALGSKISIAAGAIWFALVLFWILPFDATAFVAALTAVLGGVVLLGSNATTWEQTAAALHVAEATRADMIASLDLRLVSDESRMLH
jgi:hypothetical protein